MAHPAPEQPPRGGGDNAAFIVYLVGSIIGMILLCALCDLVAPWATVTH